MKKILTALTLVASFAAFAGGLEVEYGHERSNLTGQPRVPSDYVSVTPSTEIGGFEVGVKLEASRDTATGSTFENKSELQVQHDVFKLGNFKTAAQVGLGRDYTTVGSDFNYYQVSIKPKYQINDKLALDGSYRFRNSFNEGNNFLTHTAKVGVAYQMSKNYEVGVRVGKKIGGDEQGNFLETGIAYSF